MAESRTSSNPMPLPADLLSDDDIAQLTGLDQLRAILEGRVAMPTMGRTLAFRLHRVADGEAEFVGEPTADFMNPLGTVHGGWAAAILDSALGCAVHSTLDRGARYTTLELKVNLTRAILPASGLYTARGAVIARGRRIATSEARLIDAAGRICAHGTTTCLIMAGGGAPPAA